MYETFGEEYCSVALGINKLLPGYVSHYYGPIALTIQKKLEQEETTIKNLFRQIEGLSNLLDEEDKIRENFLKKEIYAMEITVRKLNGEEFDYRDEVKKLYDIEATRMPEKEISSIHEELSDVFGSTDLNKSVEEWRSLKIINPEKMQYTLDILKKEYARRAHQLLPIPDMEECNFKLVTNKPWRGLSGYKGNFKTTVRINVDAPYTLNSLPGLVAHEAYPGHHIENCLREKFLTSEKNFLDVSTPIIQTPRRVISNSLGNLGIDILYENPKDLYRWLANDFNIKISDRDLKIMELLRKLTGTRKNVAMMLYEDNKTEDEAVDYLVNYGLFDKLVAKNRVGFSTYPLYKSHIFCYYDTTMKKMLPKLRNNLFKLYTSQFSITQIDEVFP